MTCKYTIKTINFEWNDEEAEMNLDACATDHTVTNVYYGIVKK